MEFDYEIHEFDPIEIDATDANLTRLFPKIVEQPEMVQPVKAISAETRKLISTFYMSVIMDAGDVYVQLEGFSSPEYGNDVTTHFPSSRKWNMIQPGVYRLKISA